MRASRQAAGAALLLCIVALPLHPQTPQASGWTRCCGISPWPNALDKGAGTGTGAHGMMRPGMMGPGMMGGSMRRNHDAMMGRLPPAYANTHNPLPVNAQTVAKGEKIYAANCVSCHGVTGQGDGPAARGLDPPPANLAWLSRMPMGQWDPLMYWTIAEGGASYGTAMPAFKTTLSENDIWAVIGYIQARLPAPDAN